MKKNDASLRFLYKTPAGRVILKLLTARSVSNLAGKFLDSKLSKPLINRFIKNNGIDLSEYESDSFDCFNDCFSRKIKKENRPFDMSPDVLVSPCDGLLSVFDICDGCVFPIKQSEYSVTSLLGGDKIAEKYRNGKAAVIRLCVDNYHRYAYIDNGTKSDNVFIPGKLHTVRPIALEHHPVFCENCREYTVMSTENFGCVTQVEVGAMLVGKILNHHGASSFCRGEEKGTFLYGGSTVVLLFEPDTVVFDERFGCDELPVKMGSKIGFRLNKAFPS